MLGYAPVVASIELLCGASVIGDEYEDMVDIGVLAVAEWMNVPIPSPEAAPLVIIPP